MAGPGKGHIKNRFRILHRTINIYFRQTLNAVEKFQVLLVINHALCTYTKSKYIVLQIQKASHKYFLLYRFLNRISVEWNREVANKKSSFAKCGNSVRHLDLF